MVWVTPLLERAQCTSIDGSSEAAVGADVRLMTKETTMQVRSNQISRADIGTAVREAGVNFIIASHPGALKKWLHSNI